MNGTTLKYYHIDSLLGVSGLSKIYLATDTRLDRPAIIKFLQLDHFPPADFEIISDLFFEEAQILASLYHPNVLTVFDVGFTDTDIKLNQPIPYVVTEYASNSSLNHTNSQQQPTWQELFKILLPIMDAISYAHKKGFAHLNIRPSKILFTSQNISLITGFSSIKRSDLKLYKHPLYSAPETFNGEETALTDQFLIGIMIYRLLTNSDPYKYSTPKDILRFHGSPISPRSVLPSLPKEADELILKMIQKDPADRFDDLDQVKKGMETLLNMFPLMIPK